MSQLPRDQRPLVAGSPAAAARNREADARVHVQGARKHVTVLFVDIVGSTRLLSVLDPEDAQAFLSATVQVLEGVVERNSGAVVQAMGDGLFALFGAPLALENHAFLACNAALELQRVAATLPEMAGQRPRLRVGLNSGIAAIQFDSRERQRILKAAGEVIHRAAHLEARCAPGQVLVGAETVRLAGHAIDVQRAAEAETLKGADQVCFELMRCGNWSNGLRVDAVDRQIPFAGRRRERVVFSTTVEDLMRGRGAMLALIGETGLGKSRLLVECLAGLDPERCHAISTACMVTEQGEPMAVLRRLVLGLLNLGEESTQRPADALRSMIAAVAPCAQESADALTWLLFEEAPRDNQDREAAYAEAMNVLEKLVTQGAVARPLVIAVDDVQWIDTSSRAFVARLGRVCTNHPLLVLVTSRADLDELGVASQQVLKLLPIDREDLVRILDGVEGAEKLRVVARERALDRCAGNPRFLVEIARSMVASAYDEDNDRVEELEIPESVADLFEERIDKLQPEDRALLQLAAAYEQWLPSASAVAVTGVPEPEVLEAMQRLQLQGLVRLAGHAQQATMLVSNPIVARAAYRSLLRSDRQRIHERIIATASSDAQAPSETRWLARQAFRAGQYDAAAQAFFDAGRHALARLAYSEAAGLLRAAIRAHDLAPSRGAAEAVDMRLALRDALFPGSDFENIDSVLAQAHQIASSAGDAERLRQVDRQLVSNLMALGRLEACLPSARRLATAFLAGARNSTAADEAALLAQVLMSLGQYAEALELCTDLVAYARGSDEHVRQVQHSLTLMWALWCAAELGRFESAIPLVIEAQANLDPSRSPLLRLCAGIATGLYWLRYGDDALAVDTLSKVMPLSERDDTKAWFPAVASPLGLALARLRRCGEALPLLRSAVERTPVRGGTGRGLRVAHLAECYLLCGETELALHCAMEAVTFSERVREAGAAAHARLGLARALDSVGRLPEARATAEAVVRQASDLSMEPLCREAERFARATA